MKSRQELYKDIVWDDFSKEVFKMFKPKLKKLEEIETIEKAIEEGLEVKGERRQKLQHKESFNQSVEELTKVLQMYKKFDKSVKEEKVEKVEPVVVAQV